GLMSGLAARGRRAGADFALTGFDDIPEAAVSAPPLTTIAVAPRERGMQAARLVLERLAGAQGRPAAASTQAPRTIVADARLVVRASSLLAQGPDA
ncbi:MAG TPA: substrate-binding domain-containing protein, partial [Luteimonas sp.]|nr:substrate-binding domain-containing protein [Luteimonas sp.]